MTHKSLAHLSEKEAEELAATGLTVDEYEHFTTTFVHQPYRYIYRKGDHWMSPPGAVALNNRDLIRHLSGARAIGTRCGEVDGKLTTTILAFDIDARPDDPSWDRLAALGALLGPPLLFQSSDSCGRHAYYFLDRPVELLTLFDWRDPLGDTLVGNALRKINLPVQDGFLEVYPQGTIRGLPRGSKGSTGRAFRLPFGPDSILLDPSDFVTPLAPTPQDSLRLFHRESLDRHLGQLTIEALRAAGDGAPPPVPKPEIARKTRAKRAEVERVKSDAGPVATAGVDLATGLTGPGQTHAGLMSAAIAYAPVAANENHLLAKVLEWFEEHHNGHSRTLNSRGWDAVRADAEGCVLWAWPRRSLGPGIGLTVTEVARNHLLALAMTSGPSASLGSNDLFRLELLMADIVSHAKQWVIWQTVQRVGAVRSQEPAQPPSERTLFEKVVRASREYWPDPHAPLFVVPMPWALRIRYPGYTAAMLGRLFGALRDHGFITLLHKASALQGVSARYLVQLDFSAEDALTAQRKPGLPAHLGLTLSPEAVRAQYGRAHRRRILAAAMEAGTHLFGDDAALVRAVLSSGGCWSCAVAHVREQAAAVIPAARVA